jgi:cephalosporin hydroxylase
MDDVTQRFARRYWGALEQTFVPNTWLGVPCWQNPFDVWVVQEIIGETRPDVIVETGTLAGGGALLWASLLAMYGPGDVISIDINELHAVAADHDVARDRVTFLTGSSTDPTLVADVGRRVAGKRTMVILDSDHSSAHVLGELEAWAPLVTKGCYLIVQDGFVTYVDESLVPGPLEAIQKWLPNNPEFEVDEGRERMLFTFCPSGFLRRRDDA